jgi:hypothetical protein
MQKEISLKLCLLTSITEKSEEEVAKEVLIAHPESNGASCQVQRKDKKNSVSGGMPTRYKP